MNTNNLLFKRILLLAFCLITYCSSCISQNNLKTKSPVKGVWSVQSVKWIYPDTTYHLKQPQPGFLQFSDHRYSFIWTPSESPRVPFAKLSQPTLEEMQAGFRSIVLNAGTYEVKGSQITITAEVAKVPGFEGGVQVFDFAIDEEKLTYTMIDETYPSGEKPAWFGKMKTEFILEKIDE